ncbi:MAG: hypothetical protein H0U18_14770 [Pyrinomonadaceae bacterium]|nr:hypothetical protein [Pyrinomonadaceae bacterium]
MAKPQLPTVNLRGNIRMLNEVRGGVKQCLLLLVQFGATSSVLVNYGAEER